ncbi:hypothetical protein FACS189443_6410 [Planctomycetales bacterium]|nr:hypothetical protein FACS189443_6410 [Planctomycetales bacterium]
MIGKPFRVDGCRRDNQFQIGTLRQNPFQHSEQEVDVERPFVGFVDDDGVVLAEVAVALRFGEQDSVGHQFDERVGAAFFVEPHFVSDSVPDVVFNILFPALFSTASTEELFVLLEVLFNILPEELPEC